MNGLRVENPPPYNQSSCRPLVLAETTTTRTEVVTTTTTETTTHSFSLPYFRKGDGPSHQSSKDDSSYSNHKLPSPRLPSDIALSEKALPPTPPNETENDPVIIHGSQDLAASSPVRATEVRLHFATAAAPQTHSMAAHTHAALGKGRPRTSPSVSYAETNTVPFVPSEPSIPALMPTVRKSRSFQWLKRGVSDNHAPLSNDDHPSHSASERRRGLSFGATSTGVPGDGDKGKPTEFSSVGPKAPPKNMSRRPSFWRKKRASPSNEPSNHPSHNEGVILALPPLPPVHQVSPFDISHPTGAPSSTLIQTTATTPAREMSKSCSEINERTLPPAGPSIPPQRAPFSDPSCDVRPREIVAFSPRPRAQTNPPFFRRLSMGVFSTMEPSSPLDLHASNSAQPLPITPTIVRQAVHKPVIPRPLSNEESPDIYLTRLQSAVSKAEVAGILASRYAIFTTYLYYIHFRTVQIHFMSRLFGHTSTNSAFLAFPLTLHCGNCSWK